MTNFSREIRNVAVSPSPFPVCRRRRYDVEIPSKFRRSVDDDIATLVGRLFIDEISTSEFLRPTDVEKWSESYLVTYRPASDVAFTSLPNVLSTAAVLRPTDVEKWSENYLVKYLSGSDVAFTSLINVLSTSKFLRPSDVGKWLDYYVVNKSSQLRRRENVVTLRYVDLRIFRSV